MATTTPPAVRAGLHCLICWLGSHPELPVAYVERCEEDYAELRLAADEHTALSVAADLATMLDEPAVTVVDYPADGPDATVCVTGWAGATTAGARMEIGANVDIRGQARVDLLNVPSYPPAGSLEVAATVAQLRTAAGA